MVPVGPFMCSQQCRCVALHCLRVTVRRCHVYVDVDGWLCRDRGWSPPRSSRDVGAELGSLLSRRAADMVVIRDVEEALAGSVLTMSQFFERRLPLLDLAHRVHDVGTLEFGNAVRVCVCVCVCVGLGTTCVYVVACAWSHT